MIYTIALLLALAAIIFFHYLEGFFSATLSAIFAVIAAAMAVGYHETIVETFLGGRFASESHALVLLILFAVVYLILRLVFDQLIKGNIRLPSTVDKIGAAIMGLVAGIFALGVVTIAVQELPFGPDVAGYKRYAVSPDRTVAIHVSGYRNDMTPAISDELVSDEVGKFDPAQLNHLFPAVDDAVVGTVSLLSNGSLAGTQPLGDIHPDWLQELFGQRLGLENGAQHTALNLKSAGQQQVSVAGVYVVSSVGLDVMDQYDPKLRVHPLDAIATIANLNKQAKGSTQLSDQMLLVVRTQFSHDAADGDYVRFSPGNIRLVARGNDLGTVGPVDYYPIGTLENDKLYVDKPDDYLFLNLAGGDRAVDLVFLVDRWKDAAGKPMAQMPSPSFLEVKRLARVNLSGKPIDTKPPTGKIAVGVLHVSSGPSAAPLPPPPGRPIVPAPKPGPAPTPGQPAPTPGQPQPPQNPSQNPMSPHSLVPGAAGALLDVQDVTISSELPTRLGTTADAAKQRNTTLAGGNAILIAGKAKSLALDGTELASDAGKGDVAITELAPRKGMTLLRITAKPGGDNSWAWTSHVKTLAAVDAAGNSYPPQGVWAMISIAGKDHLMVQYAADDDLEEITPTDGTVTSLVFYVAVPTNTPLKQLTLDGKQIKDLAGLDTSH